MMYNECETLCDRCQPQTDGNGVVIKVGGRVPKTFCTGMLRALFVYDPLTGLVTHRIDRHRVSAGDPVGTLKPNVYIEIPVPGHGTCRAHRLIWAMCYGVWPITLDHRNGDRSDNRIENLREVTNAENQRNTKLSSANKSGIKGVYWRADRQKWHAKISFDGKERHLGYFKTIEAAAAARAKAELEHGYTHVK